MRTNRPYKILGVFFTQLIAVFSFAQSNHHHAHSHLEELRKALPIVPNYTFDQDSLVGFNFDELNKTIITEKYSVEDAKRYSYLQKRDYIDYKYALGKYYVPRPTTNIIK